jgi:thiol-disulfide isomerase/thioredoxin
MNGPSRRAVLLAAGAAATSPGCLGDDGSADGLRFSALDAAGSDGGTVPERPPGEPALLDFFATWCPPCRPQMDELARVHEARPSFHLVSISWEDDPDAIRAFWRDHDGQWPVVRDPNLAAAEAHGVDRLPTKVLLDGDGDERWRHVGLATAEQILEAIAAVSG